MQLPRTSIAHFGPASSLAAPGGAAWNWMMKTKGIARTATAPRMEVIRFTGAPRDSWAGRHSTRLGPDPQSQGVGGGPAGGGRGRRLESAPVDGAQDPPLRRVPSWLR